MKKILLLFVLLNFCLTNCSKKENVEHYVISKDLKQWVDFKEGSYWVYFSENSGFIDSCHFIGTKLIYTEYRYEEYGYIYDVIEFPLESTFIHGIVITAEKDFSYVGIGTNEGGDGYVLRTNSTIGQKIKVGLSIYEEVEVLDSLNIYNNTFFNVRHTWKKYPLLNGDLIQDYYFAKGVGLVKYHQNYLQYDSTWQLIRWKAIQ